MGNSNSQDNIHKLENKINFNDVIANRARQDNERINEEKRLKLERLETRTQKFDQIADKMIEIILEKIKKVSFTRLSDDTINIQGMYIPKTFQKLHCIENEIIRGVNSEDTEQGDYYDVHWYDYRTDSARYVELENWFINKFNKMFTETMKITELRLSEVKDGNRCVCWCCPCMPCCPCLYGGPCSSFYGYGMNVNIQIFNNECKN